MNVEKVVKGRTSYSVAEVVYENDRGEKKTWKLMSFSNPQVFATISAAKQGDSFDITTGKNDKDYTIWAAATPASTGASVPGAQSSGSVAPTKVVGSNYETREERAVRQRLIVRQSSLSTAVDYLKAVEEKDASLERVLDLAESFTNFVFEAPDLFDQQNDLPE